MRKPTKKKGLKPLAIYLIGSFLAIVSGLVVKPWSPGLHQGLCILAIAICLFGIYRHFKS